MLINKRIVHNKLKAIVHVNKENPN